MFFKRSYQPEIMDDFSIRDQSVDAALDELKLVNKFLGGITTTFSGLKSLVNNINDKTSGSNPNAHISVLDIGAGASDILLKLKGKACKLNITSVDINPRACIYLKNNTPIDNIVCGDVNYIPFNTKFDFVHASLFLHHFSEDEITQLLKSLSLISSRGIIINDLRRSVLAYLGIKILTTLFSNSKMVKNDGPLSVKRSFVKRDWDKILSNAGINKYIIKRKWAFRWLVVIYND